VNAATADELVALPGIGPVTAQRIVDWRVEHGRFASVDQLRQVPGIGPAKLAQIRGRVTV
jgi:competence protein ComEA helix-hairpin-helix repeat region